MKKLLLALIVSAAVLGCERQHGMPPPPFDLPSGVTCEGDDRIEFHSFRWEANETTALFMMSPHPVGLNHTMVDKIIEDARPRVVDAMLGVEGVAELETSIDDILAGDFSGKAIVCKLGMPVAAP